MTRVLWSAWRAPVQHVAQVDGRGGGEGGPQSDQDASRFTQNSCTRARRWQRKHQLLGMREVEEEGRGSGGLAGTHQRA